MYKGLQYKTRGNVSPQGKLRVYFCCHPEDLSKTFDPITNEILHMYGNAGIWFHDPADNENELYDSERTALNDEFAADLALMQLFVVPVTARFLFSDDPARTLEFTYAVEHHIPVLPLMQEGGLESEFNRICGDMQFLYKDDRDPTALPYEDKLKKFLDSVLIGDELAAKVRAAFDAYIFLSYRKKDRKYAREIMRLIHQNDFCRDIAIWYDEYLTPGESFNDAIAEALQKSRLFALVVTPSLLENPNYVMQIEYPQAREADKNILPIIARETDYEQMQFLYKDIDQGIDKDDSVKLSDALKQRLGDIAREEVKDEPVHLFFMALAYLSGIDVEVNHERALSLMTDAAEADLPEAYEKLVTMYNTGEGVARNYETAIRWQTRYVAWLKQTDDREKLFAATDDLTGMQISSRMMTDALESALELEALAASFADPQYQVTACRRLAEIYRLMGQYYKAVKTLKQAAALLRGNSSADLAVIYNRIGEIYGHTAHFPESLEYQNKSLEVIESLLQESDDVRVRRMAADIYRSYGSSLAVTPVNRVEYLKKAISILEQLIEETDADTDRFILSDCYVEIGELVGAEGNYDITKTSESLGNKYRYLHLALNLREELRNRLDTVESMDRLSDIYVSLARSEVAGTEERQAYIQKSNEINKSLYERTRLNSYQEKIRLNTALLNQIEGTIPPEEAPSVLESWNLVLTGSAATKEEILQMYLAEIKDLEDECGTERTEEKLRKLAEYCTQASVNTEDEKLRNELQGKARTVRLETISMRETPSSLRAAINDLHHLYIDYYKPWDESGIGKALEYLDQEVELCLALAEMTGSESDYASAAETIHLAVKVNEDQDKRDRLFRKIQEITDSLSEQNNIDRCLWCIATVYLLYASEKKEKKEYQAAAELFQKAAEIYKENTERTNDPFAWKKLAECYENLTETAAALNDYDTALEYCKKLNDALNYTYENDRQIASQAMIYSKGYAWLARIMFHEGAYDIGMKAYYQFLDFFADLLDQDLPVKLILDLSSKLNDGIDLIGSTLYESGKEKTEAILKRRVEVTKTYYHKHKNIHTESGYSGCLLSLARFYQNNNDYPSALRYYLRVKETINGYIESAGTSERLEKKLKNVSERIENLIRQFSSSEEFLQAAYMIYQEEHNRETAEIYARACLRRGSEEKDARNPEKAKELLKTAADMFKVCSDGSSYILRQEANVYMELGNTCLIYLEEYEEALKNYRCSAEACERLIEKDPHSGAHYAYFTALQYIARSYQMMDKPAEAIDWYRKAIADKDNVLSESGDTLQINLVVLLPMCRLLDMDEVSLEEKREISLEVLKTLERFKDEDPGPGKKIFDAYTAAAQYYSSEAPIEK
ncbi:MAG: tetratricopeptide repeat protein [Solobacterium sp.]|nr:tetratricopeptide repeat protein [Solobacterium sp.]